MLFAAMGSSMPLLSLTRPTSSHSPASSTRLGLPVMGIAHGGETVGQDAAFSVFSPAHGLIFESFDPIARSATSVS